jgi:hypothetical protein
VGAERKGREDVRCEDVTETLLHTDALTQKHFYTQTPTPLHRDTFYTHTRFYAYILTQTLLQTDSDAFTHKHFYTQTLLNTTAFTHRRFYTQLLFTQKL